MAFQIVKSALTKASGIWNELLHPRDYHGRFVSKGGSGAGDLKQYTAQGSNKAVALYHQAISQPGTVSHIYHGSNGVSKYQFKATKYSPAVVLTVKANTNGTYSFHTVNINTGYLKPSGAITKEEVKSEEFDQVHPGEVFQKFGAEIKINSDGTGHYTSASGSELNYSAKQVHNIIGGNPQWKPVSGGHGPVTGSAKDIHLTSPHGDTVTIHPDGSVDAKDSSDHGGGSSHRGPGTLTATNVGMLKEAGWTDDSEPDTTPDKPPTQIVTPVKDLKPGDQIIGTGGHTYTVNSLVPQGNGHELTVTDETGSEYTWFKQDGSTMAVKPGGEAKFDNGLTGPKTFYLTSKTSAFHHVVIQPDGSGQFYNDDGSIPGTSSGTWPVGHYTADKIKERVDSGKWSTTPVTPEAATPAISPYAGKHYLTPTNEIVKVNPDGTATWVKTGTGSKDGLNLPYNADKVKDRIESHTWNETEAPLTPDQEKKIEQFKKGIWSLEEMKGWFTDTQLLNNGIDPNWKAGLYQPGAHYITGAGQEVVLQSDGSVIGLDGTKSKLSSGMIKEQIENKNWALKDSLFPSQLDQYKQPGDVWWHNMSSKGLSDVLAHPDGGVTFFDKTNGPNGKVTDWTPAQAKGKVILQHIISGGSNHSNFGAPPGVTATPSTSVLHDEVYNKSTAGKDLKVGDILQLGGENAIVTKVDGPDADQYYTFHVQMPDGYNTHFYSLPNTTHEVIGHTTPPSTYGEQPITMGELKVGDYFKTESYSNKPYKVTDKTGDTLTIENVQDGSSFSFTPNAGYPATLLGHDVAESTPSGAPTYSGQQSDIHFTNKYSGNKFTVHPDGSAEITGGNGEAVMEFPAKSYGPSDLANVNPDEWKYDDVTHMTEAPPASDGVTVGGHHFTNADIAGLIAYQNANDKSSFANLLTASGVVSGYSSSPGNPDALYTAVYDHKHSQSGVTSADALMQLLGAKQDANTGLWSKDGIGVMVPDEEPPEDMTIGISEPKAWSVNESDLSEKPYIQVINPDGSGQMYTWQGDTTGVPQEPGFWNYGDVNSFNNKEVPVSVPGMHQWGEGTTTPTPTPQAEPPKAPEPEAAPEPEKPSIGNFDPNSQLHLDMTEVPGQWKSDNGGPGTGQPGLEKLPDELGVGHIPADVGFSDVKTGQAVNDLFSGGKIAETYNTPSSTVYRLTDGRNLVFTKSGNDINAKLVDEAELPNKNMGSGALPKTMSQVRCNSAATAELRKQIYKNQVQIVQTIPVSDRETVVKTSDDQYIKFERRDQGMYAKIVSYASLDIAEPGVSTGQVVKTDTEGVASVLNLPFAVHGSAQEGIKWANQAFASVHVTGGPASSIKAYTGNTYYGAINSFLGGKSTSINSAGQTHINNIDKAMATSMTPEPVRICRGWNLEDLMMDENGNPFPPEQAIGKTIKSKAFASCSVGNKAAFSGKKLQMDIYCPAGTHMVWAKSISQYPGENEMILDRNVNLYFAEVKKIGSGYGAQYYAKCYVIPDGADVDVLVPKGKAVGAMPASTLMAEGEKPPMLVKATNFKLAGGKSITAFPDGSAVMSDGTYYKPGTVKEVTSDKNSILLPSSLGGQVKKNSGTASPIAGTTAPKPGSYTHNNGAKLVVYPDGHAEYDGEQQGKGKKTYQVGSFQQQQITNSSSWTYHGGATEGLESVLSTAASTTAVPPTPTPTPATSISTPSVPSAVKLSVGDKVYQGPSGNKYIVEHLNGTATTWSSSYGEPYTSHEYTGTGKYKTNWTLVHEVPTGAASTPTAPAVPTPKVTNTTGVKLKPSVPGTHSVYTLQADGTAHVTNDKSHGGVKIVPGDKLYQNGKAGKWLVVHANGYGDQYTWNGVHEKQLLPYAAKNLAGKWNFITEHNQEKAEQQLKAMEQKDAKGFTTGAGGSHYVINPDGSGYYITGTGAWHIYSPGALKAEAYENASYYTPTDQSPFGGKLGENGSSVEIPKGPVPGFVDMKPGDKVWHTDQPDTPLQWIVDHPDGSQTGYYATGEPKPVTNHVYQSSSHWTMVHDTSFSAVNPQTGLSKPITWSKPATGTDGVSTTTINPDGSGETQYSDGSGKYPAGTYDAGDVAYLNNHAQWKKVSEA